MNTSNSGAELLRLRATFVVAFLNGIPLLAHAETDEISGALTEIVVTAQRRSESLERTALAVAALDSSMIEKQAVVSIHDLQVAVPGLTVKTGTNSNSITFSIRGQTLDEFTGSQPAVQPYLNEVPVTTTLASAFYDMSSVQVLKGPQGTLFGRNVTGGALLFTTAEPTNKLEGYVDQRFGSYNLHETQGALNIPIVDSKVLLRIAGDTVRRDGFTENIFSNSREGNVIRDSFRASLLIRPIDSITNTTVVDYSHSGGSSTPSVIYSAYAPGSTNNGIPLYATTSVLLSPLLDAAIGVPGAWDTYLAAHPGRNPGGVLAELAAQQARGPFVASSDVPNLYRATGVTVSNITAWDINPRTQLRNILGYVKADNFRKEDLDGTDLSIESGSVQIDDRTYTEELQVIGKQFDDKLSYIAGVYYDNNKELNDTHLSFYDLSPIIPVTPVRYILQQKNEAKAGYVQGTYDISSLTGVSGMSFTTGYRYTSNKVTQVVLPGSAVYNVPGLSNMEADTFSKSSWQIGMQDQLNADVLLYVTSRRSFRTGGFNPYTLQLPGTAASGGNEFKPEIATDVEVGAKFQGELAGVPARLNIAIYKQWIDDVQKEAFIIIPGRGVSGLTVNVPQAQVKGVELDGQINPVFWLQLGAAVAYTDAAFTENSATVFGQTAIYGPYPDTSRWSGSAFAEVSKALPDNIGTASIRSDIYSQSTNYFGSQEATVNPGTRISPYSVVNFRAGIEKIRGSELSVMVYVKNALDRVYYTGGTPAGSSSGFNYAIPGDPRTLFLEARYSF